MSQNPEKVMVYIDGFNLYFGIKDQFPALKWLDVHSLGQSLLEPNQILAGVKYFTARISGNPQKVGRQNTYLRALQTTPTQLIYGHYKSSTATCTNCGHLRTKNEEKMTDVNIAVTILVDALDDVYDTAILISGDSDLVPPISVVKDKFKKRVVIAFPPNRSNNSISRAANGFFYLNRSKLVHAQFPPQIQTPQGFIIQKPVQW